MASGWSSSPRKAAPIRTLLGSPTLSRTRSSPSRLAARSSRPERPPLPLGRNATAYTPSTRRSFRASSSTRVKRLATSRSSSSSGSDADAHGRPDDEGLSQPRVPRAIWGAPDGDPLIADERTAEHEQSGGAKGDGGPSSDRSR